jgi:hypothetical protein
LAQQLATTGEVVASLAVERQWEANTEGVGLQNGGHTGHHQGVPHPHITRSTSGRTRNEEDRPIHRVVLPKLPFLKFTGQNPRIWIDKCGDYFHIFNIPESMWTTAASLHFEENVVKWWQVFVTWIGYLASVCCSNRGDIWGI